jgi:rhamnose transport system permease protein
MTDNLRARLSGLALSALLRWEPLLLLLIVAAGIWGAALSPFFLTSSNLLDLISPYIYIGLMAIGLTFLIIAGEIDISVTSTLAVAAVAAARIWQAGVPVWGAVVLSLLIATALGLVNGLLVAGIQLPSLAITLGTMGAYSALAYLIIPGAEVALPLTFVNQLNTSLGQVPVMLLFFLACVTALGFLLHGTRFGRYAFTIGSNTEAARFSGVPRLKVRVSAFVLSGFMAGLAAISYLGYIGEASADAATGDLLRVVTVVVLGGIDIFGGGGSMLGVFLALILIAEVSNGMQLANIPSATQSIVIGCLLIAALLLGNVSRRARNSALSRRTRFNQPAEEVTTDESPSSTEDGAAVASETLL